MDRYTIVLTTDKRQEKLASLLEGERVSYAWVIYYLQILILEKEKLRCVKTVLT